MAAAAIDGFLPLRRNERKRAHSRVWAFHAISRTRLGAAATFGVASSLFLGHARLAQSVDQMLSILGALEA